MLDDTLRTLLKDLFGKPQRIVLAAWILERDGEPFFLAEAAQGVRGLVGDSNLTYELDRFVAHLMLRRHPDGRRNYYTLLEHDLWKAFRDISLATGLDSELRRADLEPSDKRQV